MITQRIIPCLLLKGTGLVKSVKFDHPKYIGDPINTVKIFNDKEVDELFFLDIHASRNGNKIQFDLLKDIAQEAFMPLSYGGGINSLNDMEKIFATGFEKVCLNQALLENPELVKEAAKIYGSQSIVACIDVNKNLFGSYYVYDYKKNKNTNISPRMLAEQLIDYGIGEIIFQFVYSDGTMSGYDFKFIEQQTQNLPVPLVTLGGAGSHEDFKKAFKMGASGVSAGSLFVYHGPHRAVLINYPSQKEIQSIIT